MQVGSNRHNRVELTGRGGFTLVELLAVVAIIGILAAILFPAFSKAKETARTSSCLANMREIGIGLNMYVDEYNSRFPSAVPWGSPTYWNARGESTIQELLSPFVRNGMMAKDAVAYDNPSVFACPSDSGLPSEFVGAGSLWGVPARETIWKNTGCSYEYYACNQEDWLVWENANRPPVVAWTALSPVVRIGSVPQRVGAPMHAVAHPSRKAVMGDTYFWHMGDVIPDGGVAYRNTLFADGHAQRVIGSYHLQARLQQLSHWHAGSELSD